MRIIVRRYWKPEVSGEYHNSVSLGNCPILSTRLASSTMILDKIWKSVAAQFNKLANAIRGYDPIAEMQYEYDRSVEQIKEGREGLAQIPRPGRASGPPGQRAGQARLATGGESQGVPECGGPRNSGPVRSGAEARARTIRRRTKSNWPFTNRPTRTTW